MKITNTDYVNLDYTDLRFRMDRDLFVTKYLELQRRSERLLSISIATNLILLIILLRLVL